MAVRNITKQLAGAEDLLLGKAQTTEEQVRNGNTLSISKIDMPLIIDAIDGFDLSTVNTDKYRTIEFLGYYTKGDGGGGLFYFDEFDTTSSDNGGTILVSGTKRWKRRYNGAVNVKWFGAKGDGITDDTEAIQKALNLLNIFIPSGTYYINEVLVVKSNSIIRGELETVLRGKYGIFTTINSDVRQDHIVIENLELDGVDKSNDSSGIYIESSFCRIIKIKARNFKVGILLNEGWTNYISNVNLRDNTTGLQIWEKSNNVTVNFCEIEHNDGYGIVIQGVRNTRIINCGIEKNGYAGIWVHGGVQATREVVIANNYLEDNVNDPTTAPEDADIYVNKAGKEISNISIVNNYFDGVNAPKGIHLADCNSGLIMNNNKKSTLGWGSVNVMVLNNEVDYSGTANDKYSSIFTVDHNKGIMIDGRLSRFTVKRYENELFSAGSNGDSDTLRLIAKNLPTSDPGVDGQLWNDSGTVKVSAG